jgi:hypothetical protein
VKEYRKSEKKQDRRKGWIERERENGRQKEREKGLNFPKKYVSIIINIEIFRIVELQPNSCTIFKNRY